MAKTKKGPALFEVIRAAQQKQLEQQRKDQQRLARESARGHAAEAGAGSPATGTLQQAAALLKSHGFWLGSRAAQSATAEGAQPAAQAAVAPPARAVFRTAPPVIARAPVTREVPQAEIELAPAREHVAFDLSPAAHAVPVLPPAPPPTPQDDDPVNDGMQGGVRDDAREDARDATGSEVSDFDDAELADTPSAFDHPAVSYVPADDAGLHNPLHNSPRDHLTGANAAEPVFREVHERRAREEFVCEEVAHEVSNDDSATPAELHSRQSATDEIIEQPEVDAPAIPPVAYAAPAAPSLAPRSDPAAEAMRRVREEIAASAVTPASSSAPELPRTDAAGGGFDALSDYFKTPHDPAAAGDRGTPWYARLPLGYGAGIAAGLALVVLGGVVLSVLLSGNKIVAAEDAQRPDKRPDVLNLKSPVAVAPEAVDAARARPDTAGKVDVVAPKAITPPATATRVTGHQYLVLISCKYEKDARDMTKFLADNGVGATVEHALPRRGKWYTVITTRGFERTKDNPEFAAFEASIIKLMTQYNRKSIYAAGKPAVYGWR